MLSFALIGQGPLFKEHASVLEKNGFLKALCFTDSSASDAAENVPVYDNIDELLTSEPKIDVITIVAPVGLHAEIIIKSLQAGKHVVCNGPLSITTAAAWQIVETAKFCRRKVVMGNIFRVSKSVIQLKELLKERLGSQVMGFHLDIAFPIQDRDLFKPFPHGPLLYRNGILFDLAIALFGNIANVGAFQKRDLQNEFEISGAGALEMESGIPGALTWGQYEGPGLKALLSIKSKEATLEIKTMETFENGAIEILTGGNVQGPSHSMDLMDLKLYYQDITQGLLQSKADVDNIMEGVKVVTFLQNIYKQHSSF